MLTTSEMSLINAFVTVFYILSWPAVHNFFLSSNVYLYHCNCVYALNYVFDLLFGTEISEGVPYFLLKEGTSISICIKLVSAQDLCNCPSS